MSLFLFSTPSPHTVIFYGLASFLPSFPLSFILPLLEKGDCPSCLPPLKKVGCEFMCAFTGENRARRRWGEKEKKGGVALSSAPPPPPFFAHHVNSQRQRLKKNFLSPLKKHLLYRIKNTYTTVLHSDSYCLAMHTFWGEAT